MSYVYTEQRDKLFTEQGVAVLLRVRTNAERALKAAGAVRAQEATAGVGGDSWTQLAALDFMVEQGEIVEVTGGGVWGQHRVFVAAR